MAIKKLDRRTFLRGVGGVSIALPALEITLGSDKAAAATSFPQRFGIFFVGQSLGADHDRRNFFVPPDSGAAYTTSVGLKPLDTYNVKSEVSVISGLYIPTGTGPGERGQNFHPYAHWPTINGTHNSSTLNGTEGNTISEGADQIIGRTLGAGTKFQTLNFSAQADFYIPGYSYGGRDVITFQKRSDGTVQRVKNQTSPQAAFQALFGSFSSSGPTAAELAAQNRRRSILDAILSDRDKLLRSLGVADRNRVTQHLDEIRALERSIASTTSGGGNCQKPPDPGADPTVEIGNRYSNEFRRNRIFMDLIHMAFACDMTRAATHMLTTAQCHMSVKNLGSAFANIASGCEPHEIGHNAGGGPLQPPAGTPAPSLSNPALAPSDRNSYLVSLIHAWHVDHFSYLLDKLKKTPEGSGNMLDNCALILMFEGGHGRLLNNPGDTSKAIGTHSTENMAMLLAGRAGGLKPGKHIVKTGVHPARVTISAMQAVGSTSDTLGEIKGNVQELFTS
ncbi:MAG: DUF1552 domain-containing protein [Bdellovibrionales bacterium]